MNDKATGKPKLLTASRLIFGMSKNMSCTFDLCDLHLKCCHAI